MSINSNGRSEALNPRHTWIAYDCRPAKSALHALIDKMETNDRALGKDLRRERKRQAIAEVIGIARTIPGIGSAEEFAGHVANLAAAHDFARAHKLVDVLGDRVLRTGLRTAFVLLTLLFMLAALIATIAFLASSASALIIGATMGAVALTVGLILLVMGIAVWLVVQ